MPSDLIGEGIHRYPESFQQKHRERLAEYAKIPRVSSHDLAKQLLALPDCSVLILWGSYEIPVQIDTDRVETDREIVFYG